MRRFLLVLLLVLPLAGCEIVQDGPTPTATASPTEPVPPGVPPISLATPSLPAVTTQVRTVVKLYDDQGVEAPPDSFLAELEFEVHYPPREGRPVPNQATLINIQSGQPETSPALWEDFLPLDATHQISGVPIFIRITGTATLGPYWYMECELYVDGIRVMRQRVNNDQMLPTEKRVDCIV